MATCVNHPSVTATKKCQGCGGDFCENCVVTLAGQVLCANCKTGQVRGLQQAQIAYKLPGEALKYAIVGIFCFGFILAPVAIYKAAKALRQTSDNPTLPGRGKAVAAMVVGIGALVLWVVSIIVQIASIAMRAPGR